METWVVDDEALPGRDRVPLGLPRSGSKLGPPEAGAEAQRLEIPATRTHVGPEGPEVTSLFTLGLLYLADQLGRGAVRPLAHLPQPEWPSSERDNAPQKEQHWLAPPLAAPLQGGPGGGVWIPPSSGPQSPLTPTLSPGARGEKAVHLVRLPRSRTAPRKTRRRASPFCLALERHAHLRRRRPRAEVQRHP